MTDNQQIAQPPIAQPPVESTVARRSARIAARVVEGVALVVVLDHHEVLRLDEVGSRIWELCDGRTAGAICDAVVTEFEVDRARAWEDLQTFLRQLADKGAVQLEEGQA